MGRVTKDELRRIARAYGIGVAAIEPLVRSDEANQNQLHLVTALSGERFVIKLCTRADPATEGMLAHLARLTPARTLRLVNALPNEIGGYVTGCAAGDVVVTPFVTHQPLAHARPPVNRILTAVAEFHQIVADVPAPVRVRKTFASYLHRGRRPGHPLDAPLAEFITSRLPRLSLARGVVHFDLNPHNVWIATGDEVYFADFDEMQEGEYLKDLIEVGAAYVDVRDGTINLDQGVEREIYEAMILRAPGLTPRDTRLLLLRPFARGDLLDAAAVTQFIRRT